MTKTLPCLFRCAFVHTSDPVSARLASFALPSEVIPALEMNMHQVRRMIVDTEACGVESDDGRLLKPPWNTGSKRRDGRGEHSDEPSCTSQPSCCIKSLSFMDFCGVSVSSITDTQEEWRFDLFHLTEQYNCKQKPNVKELCGYMFIVSKLYSGGLCEISPAL